MKRFELVMGHELCIRLFDKIVKSTKPVCHGNFHIAKTQTQEQVKVIDIFL